MALFGGTAKRETVENEILQAMSTVVLLDKLVAVVNFEANGAGETEPENPWVNKCQSYYDSRVRTVTIAADLFEIKWVEYERDPQDKDQRVANVVKRLAYNYTSSGYTPLHSHHNEKGKEDVTVNRVIYLWTTLVHERLKAQLSDCSFAQVHEGDGYSWFEYKVPALVWKRWF